MGGGWQIVGGDGSDLQREHRGGDALQLACAEEHGFQEVYTNDSHAEGGTALPPDATPADASARWLRFENDSLMPPVVAQMARGRQSEELPFAADARK